MVSPLLPDGALVQKLELCSSTKVLDEFLKLHIEHGVNCPSNEVLQLAEVLQYNTNEGNAPSLASLFRLPLQLCSLRCLDDHSAFPTPAGQVEQC